eukprot:4586208-Pyramimonas_sp.AAC.1
MSVCYAGGGCDGVPCPMTEQFTLRLPPFTGGAQRWSSGPSLASGAALPRPPICRHAHPPCNPLRAPSDPL